MKNKYNNQHIFLFFKIEDFVKLCLHKNYNVLNIKLKKLNVQFINLFKFIKKINYLTYKLKLFNTMKIHNVIFIIYLKFVHCLFNDFYKWTIFESLLIIVKE